MSASHPCLQQKQGLGQDPSSGVCGAEGPGTQPLSGMSFPSPGTETRFPQPPDAKGTHLGFFKKAVLGFFFFSFPFLWRAGERNEQLPTTTSWG